VPGVLAWTDETTGGDEPCALGYFCERLSVTLEEAQALATEVLTNKSRSYVEAARLLAEFGMELEHDPFSPRDGEPSKVSDE
jgi:hypothetical protein